MKLAKALNDKKLDVRVVDRLVAEGKIEKGDLDKYLSDLPDESANLEHIENEVKTQSSTEQ